MAGMVDILGSLLQQGMTQSGNTRMSNTIDTQKSDGSLGDIFGNLDNLIAGDKPAAEGSGGLASIFGGLLGKLGDNAATTGGIGALIGSILGGGADSAKGAVGGGALAMLASLAMSALKNAGQAPSQVPNALAQLQKPTEEQNLDQDAQIIVLAMINAAKADGKIDESEIEKIVGKLGADGLDENDKEFIQSNLHKPLDMESVTVLAHKEPTMAAQIYAASLLAIEVDTAAEQKYMADLATALGLNSQVVAYIEESMGVKRA